MSSYLDELPLDDVEHEAWTPRRVVPQLTASPAGAEILKRDRRRWLDVCQFVADAVAGLDIDINPRFGSFDDGRVVPDSGGGVVRLPDDVDASVAGVR